LIQDSFRKLISGRSTGPFAAFLRIGLRIPACFYAIVISLRNLLYDKGRLKTHHVNATVFSIGNITAGGTGKTPLVIWLCNLLQEENIGCAVLTRGYKATKNLKLKTQSYSDEPAIILECCPEAKLVVNPNRLSAAADAVNDFDIKVLIMDDGFQHRRLARYLDIVAIDATCPFGYEKMLPAGLLREPVASLMRADAAVITRCDQVSETALNDIETQLRSANPEITIARSIHAPVYAKSADGNEIALDRLKDKKIFAFCGIGNPNAFFTTLRKLETDIVGSRVYDDHHSYTNGDITDIYEEARYLNAALILSTHKDWSKISLPRKAEKDITWAYLQIELRFISGEDKITLLIKEASAGKILKS
jgi:tetraacyldisaccharide 4'-kinase